MHFVGKVNELLSTENFRAGKKSVWFEMYPHLPPVANIIGKMENGKPIWSYNISTADDIATFRARNHKIRTDDGEISDWGMQQNIKYTNASVVYDAQTFNHEIEVDEHVDSKRKSTCWRFVDAMFYCNGA